MAYVREQTMHELSIAYNLVELACGAVEQAGAGRVQAVHLRIGALAGVVRESLEFGFEIAAAGTALAGARLEIEELPALIYCPQCEATAPLPSVQQLRCPRCGAPTAMVAQGRELELVALEVEDAPPDR